MRLDLEGDAVGDLLFEIGERLEALGESPFKVRAYYTGASILRDQRTPLKELINSGELAKLKGIGKALLEKIQSLHATGTHPTLEKLRAEVPDGLLELLRLPGLGAKKAMLLHQELGIASLVELQRAAESGKLQVLKGFTARTEAKLLKSLAFHNSTVGQVRLPEARQLAAQIEARLLELGIGPVQVAGALRRHCETVGSLSFLVSGPVPEALPEQTRIGVHLQSTTPNRSAADLLFATGSEAHLQALQIEASAQGLTLSSEGLKREGQSIPLADEAELYAALKLPFIAPEFREGRGELEAARRGELQSVIQKEDYCGILHCHSTYSDGVHTLREMAERVRALGMQYFGIADHSQSAAYAGGLKEDRVLQQHAEVDALNAEYAAQGLAFRVLKGIESDILEDGSLDYPDSFLKCFDYVVASVHSRFELDETQQTERVLKAIAHPATTILAHPTGRLLLRRPGYALDLPAVLKACAQHGVAIEINAHPMRLDLDWRWHEVMRTENGWFAINPDAHHTAELDYFTLGVEIARKGRVPKARVLNVLSLSQLQTHLGVRKARI